MSKTFDFHSARFHFELLSQHNHQSNMGDLERQLHSRERELDGVTDEELGENSREDGHQSAESSTPSATLQSEQRRFEMEGNLFWDVFNSMSATLSDIVSSNSEQSYPNFDSNLDHREKVTVKDH